MSEKQVRLDDVVLRRELITVEAALRSVVANNATHEFAGHVDAARVILATIIQATPREVQQPEEAVAESVESD